MKTIDIRRFRIQHTMSVCLFVAVLGWSPRVVEATGFNGGSGSTDYNDPLNWEIDQLPGTSIIPPADGDDAVIGFVAVGADGVQFQNPAVVDLNATPIGSPQFRDLIIGDGPDGNGTLNQSAGTLATGSTNWTFIGRNGTVDNPAVGTYNLSGSAVFDGTGALIAGADGGGGIGDFAKRGFVTVADNAQLFTNALNLGRSDNALGQLDQTGGLVSVNDWAAFGENATTAGHYNLSGGTFEVLGDGLAVGQKGDGSFNVSGSSTVDLTNLRVGRNAGGVGVVSITGGSVDFIADVLTVGGEDGTFTDGQGTVRFISDSGVSPIEVFTDVFLNEGSLVDGDFDMDSDVDGADFLVWQQGGAPDGGTTAELALWQANYGTEGGFAKLEVDLETNPPPAGDVLLIDNQGFNPVNGTFLGLSEGSLVPNSGGRTITYAYNDGNDVALVGPALLSTVPEPSSLICIVGSILLTHCLSRRNFEC